MAKTLVSDARTLNIDKHNEAIKASHAVLIEMCEDKTARKEVREAVMSGHRSTMFLAGVSGLTWGFGVYALYSAVGRRFPSIQRFRALISTGVGML